MTKQKIKITHEDLNRPPKAMTTAIQQRQVVACFVSCNDSETLFYATIHYDCQGVYRGWVTGIGGMQVMGWYIKENSDGSLLVQSPYPFIDGLKVKAVALREIYMEKKGGIAC